MRNCYQFQSQNVLEHGISVETWFMDLYRHLSAGAALQFEWRLPSWLAPEKHGLLCSKLPSMELLSKYQRYHDCGKPHCKTIDDAGRQHFPNHAEVSYRTWFECGGDLATAELIREDMVVHLLKADDVADFARKPNAIALLMTALAEVHSNAQMFGGTGSDSFKIKLKHLDRRGRQIVSHIEQQQHQGVTP